MLQSASLHPPSACFSAAVSQSVSSVDGGSGNPVGELQELTQKNLWAPPVYDFTSEQGPPHAREFVCTVKLGRLSEQGMWHWLLPVTFLKDLTGDVTMHVAGKGP